MIPIREFEFPRARKLHGELPSRIVDTDGFLPLLHTMAIWMQMHKGPARDGLRRCDAIRHAQLTLTPVIEEPLVNRVPRQAAISIMFGGEKKAILSGMPHYLTRVATSRNAEGPPHLGLVQRFDFDGIVGTS